MIFRRETEEERRANLSFETAISGTFRSQSHQELNPELIRSEKPLWKVSYFSGWDSSGQNGVGTFLSSDSGHFPAKIDLKLTGIIRYKYRRSISRVYDFSENVHSQGSHTHRILVCVDHSMVSISIQVLCL